MNLSRMIVSGALIVIGFGCVAPARASFTGTNGSIAYVLEGATPAERSIESAFLGPEGKLVPDTAKLTNTAVDRGGNAFDPATSPDGRRLAFVSTRSGRRQIYSFALGAGGSSSPSPSTCATEVCNLTPGLGESYEPAWAPGGESIAFVSTREGSAQIYRMTASGQAPTRLTLDGASDGQPAWSQTGKIAFVGDVTGTPQIYVMNGQGGELRQLTQGAGSTSPSWSPDGSELAYVGKTAAGTQTFVMAVASGEIRQLTSSAAESRLAVWSPDATKLLVTRGPDSLGRSHFEAIDPKTGSLLSRQPYLAAGEARSWAPLPPVSPNLAPPAKAGVSAIARPLSGRVDVNPTHPLTAAMSGELQTSESETPVGPTTASALTNSVEVPVNSTYNATQGVLKLTVVGGSEQQSATAILSGGAFRLVQHTAGSLATIRVLGRPRGCHRGHASIARRARRALRVRGHTKGGWSEEGESGRGSTNSTRWEVINTCRGTIYRAIEDDLWVTDPHRKHRVHVLAGHQYLVRLGGG
jgi:hypothetical protein